MKLGMDSKTLESLGYAAFINAFLDFDEKYSDEIKILMESDPLRGTANYDPKKAYLRTVKAHHDENNYMALIAAFAKMIEENNDALLLQLKQLQVLPDNPH